MSDIGNRDANSFADDIKTGTGPRHQVGQASSSTSTSTLASTKSSASSNDDEDTADFLKGSSSSPATSTDSNFGERLPTAHSMGSGGRAVGNDEGTYYDSADSLRSSSPASIADLPNAGDCSDVEFYDSDEDHLASVPSASFRVTLPKAASCDHLLGDSFPVPDGASALEEHEAGKNRIN